MRSFAFASIPFLGLGLAACVTSGDRSATGQCPQGEVCSSKTPQGLHFRGPDFADDWIADATIKRTAVGGTQTITIVNAQDEQDLTFPYTATLDSANLTAGAPNGPLLTLSGANDGTAMLRIKDAADGKLFDRVTVQASLINATDVVAFHYEELLVNDPPPSVLVGAQIYLEARLWDSGLHRLVDQSLDLGVDGATVQPISWDTVQYTPTVTGTFTAHLLAGGAPRNGASITVVDAIDQLVPGYTSFSNDFPPRAKQGLIACLEAVRGGQPVIGLDWTMSVTGADTTAAWPAKNCVDFTRNTAGTVTVHASAGGHTADMTIDVQAATAQPLIAPIRSARDATRGDVAASAEQQLD